MHVKVHKMLPRIINTAIAPQASLYILHQPPLPRTGMALFGHDKRSLLWLDGKVDNCKAVGVLCCVCACDHVGVLCISYPLCLTV